MAKIIFQGKITKYIAVKAAKKNKRYFEKNIEKGIKHIIDTFPFQKKVEFNMVSFSSKNDFLEQILSILSFLRFAGEPILWTIYSDGSHEKWHSSWLESNLPFVKIVKEDFQSSSFVLKPSLKCYETELLAYANSGYPLGKKLLYYLNHNVKQNTIFLDSDILFYQSAGEIDYLMDKDQGWFLPEWIWGTLDETYKRNTKRKSLYQVNSGFFVINKDLDVNVGLEYLKMLKGKYEYFTEQTTLHIILTKNGLWPLDPRLYFLNNCDQFDYTYNFHRTDLSIRHYTSPVRHKMWQKDWKWHLMLD